MARSKVSMCEIEIFYADGTSRKHDILLWDWHHNNFPIDKTKQVVQIVRLKLYILEVD